MKYEEMNDFDLEVLVGNALGIDWFRSPSENPTGGWIYSEGKSTNRTVLPKYCSNPSDAWPVILENNISIEFTFGGYVDVSIQTDFGRYTPDDLYPKEKLFEAAMICFLKMNEAKDE